MRILIIAEGRTGGTTLMEYLSNELSGYISITEPYTNPIKGWVKDVEWIKEYENCIVKEIFKDKYNLPKLAEQCDKVFCVYRNNWYEQTKSILYSEKVGFIRDYNVTDVDKLITDEMINERYRYFVREDKKQFQNFIRDNNYLSVSYEDLYYGNGIDKIKDYLGIQTQNIFPPVERYLKDSEGNPYKPQNNKLI